MKKFLILFISFLFSLCAFASTKFNLDRGTFSLNFSSDWRATRDLYGMPLTLSGPMVGDTRPVIMVTPTSWEKVGFDSKKVMQSYEDYKINRKKWLKKFNGKAQEFFPIEKLDWSSLDSGYSVGYIYIANDVKFIESSYYVVCKNKLFHLKYLLRGGHEKYLPETKKIIRSFQCY